MGDKEQFEFECNELEEMLIVNYKEGFSYNMSYEDDVYSVAVKLNEQQSVILKLDEQNAGYMVENLTLKKENERLKEKNEKLQWELDKTREDLNYFANLKVSAMRGSDCGHDRCYVTSMQKRGD